MWSWRIFAIPTDVTHFATPKTLNPTQNVMSWRPCRFPTNLCLEWSHSLLERLGWLRVRREGLERLLLEVAVATRGTFAPRSVFFFGITSLISAHSHGLQLSSHFAIGTCKGHQPDELLFIVLILWLVWCKSFSVFIHQGQTIIVIVTLIKLFHAGIVTVPFHLIILVLQIIVGIGERCRTRHVTCCLRRRSSWKDWLSR